MTAKLTRCDGCGFYADVRKNGCEKCGDLKWCEVCRSLHEANREMVHVTRPYYPGTEDLCLVLRAIAYVGNMIIAEVRANATGEDG